MDASARPQNLAGPALGFVLGAGVGFAVPYFGIPLLGAIEHSEALTFRIATSLMAAVFGGTVGAFIARGGAASAALKASYDDDLGEEPQERQTYATGEAVSDAELAAVAAEARAAGRRDRLARLAGVGAAVATMALLGSALFGLLGLAVGGASVLGVFVAGIAAGVGVNRALGPKVSLTDLGETGDRAGTPVDFDSLLDGAARVSLNRESTLLGRLGLTERPALLTADDTELASVRARGGVLVRLLPSWLVPFRADVVEGGARLTLRGHPLSSTLIVGGLVDGDGSITRTFGGYRLRGPGAELTLSRSWLHRSEIGIERAGERVGYLAIRRGSSLSELLAGRDVAIEVELPSGCSANERRLLLAALVAIDHRLG